MEKRRNVILTSKIKLVIWDLDETFWNGTLSEEGIKIVEKNCEIVKQLVDRGIMNSIASKNNYESVKEILTGQGVWDYFIFPCIDWVPKGEMIKWTLEKAQLRDENTLFIDDNHLNLAEAQFYNPKINIAGPEFLDEILSHESFAGKDDRQHSRLKQYKLLESKDESRKLFSSDTEFLINSNIRVEIIRDTENCFDRIFELVDRTNQLNFTKKRLSEQELMACLKNPDFDNACIQVKDNYGDYGIAGFYSLDRNNNRLEHFIFSCRILNLGVEQYIYGMLGFPKITIVPDVASVLNDREIPFWINSDNSEVQIISKNLKRKQYDLLVKGGCDLEQVFHYLQHENVNIKTEFPFTIKNNHQLRNDCTLCIKNTIELDKETQNRLIQEVPFMGSYLFNTEIFNNEYDALIFSVVNNYTTEIYREKSTGIKIPSVYRIFDEKTGKISNYFPVRGIYYDNDLLNKFKENYDYLGQMSPEEFKTNLKFMRQRITRPIIFINGPEVPFTDLENTPEPDRIEVTTERIVEMNRALDEFIAENQGCYLLDLRELILKNTDMKFTAFRYRREIYIKIAEKLLKMLEEMSYSKFKINRLAFIKAVITKFIKDARERIKFLTFSMLAKNSENTSE